MAIKVLALREDGELTYCSCPPELRGKGRCNHIAHQEEGQTMEDFLASVNEKVSCSDGKINIEQKVEQVGGITSPIVNKNYVSRLNEINITDIKNDLLAEYVDSENPNWGEVVASIPNPFTIGSKEKGTYEEAELVDFNEEEFIDETGSRVIALRGEYEFRGERFYCDFGEVPAVNEDATISINGVNWRVLPVVEQNKAGVISYGDNIVIKQEDERNIAIIMSKDPNVDTVKIYGKDVPIDVVQNFLSTGETEGLDSGQVWALKSIDPVAFERFPEIKDNLRSLKDLPVDDVGDLTDHRCIRYEDIVKEQMRLQMRRMGNTFRTNLAKRQDISDDPLSPALDEKYPLFYQVNLTDNIKSELVKRSNVQYADNLNPISALSQAQKISFTGPGGYHKDKAPYMLRMPHKSHQNIIDSTDVSSGKNVGLTATLYGGYIGEDRMIHKKDESRKSLSPSDFIPFKHHDDPSRAIMAVAHMKQACPILGGEDPLPLGDKTSDDAWAKISGAKLGKNLRTAYIPMGENYEDSVLISESAAKAMSTIQDHKYTCKETIKGVQVGQRVERKMIIGGQEVKNGGVITSIDHKNGTFNVETIYKMTPGDKLAGRHGNKCTVSKILPDSKMPKVFNQETGQFEHAEVVMSPLSVAGRKNIGQIMETNKLNTGDTDINIKQKVVLNNGHQIEATAGKQFIMRLNHISEKKLSSHADEMAAKKEAEGARLGEMESILLSTSEDRLKVLRYLRHQEAYDSHNKLNSLLKAIGVQMDGVNWER